MSATNWPLMASDERHQLAEGDAPAQEQDGDDGREERGRRVQDDVELHTRLVERHVVKRLREAVTDRREQQSSSHAARPNAHQPQSAAIRRNQTSSAESSRAQAKPRVQMPSLRLASIHKPQEAKTRRKDDSAAGQACRQQQLVFRVDEHARCHKDPELLLTELAADDGGRVHRVLGVVERVRVLSFGLALSMGCA